jgi:hypothetical protein
MLKEREGFQSKRFGSTTSPEALPCNEFKDLATTKFGTKRVNIYVVIKF